MVVLDVHAAPLPDSPPVALPLWPPRARTRELRNALTMRWCELDARSCGPT
jgi:hypothetical protein